MNLTDRLKALGFVRADEQPVVCTDGRAIPADTLAYEVRQLVTGWAPDPSWHARMACEEHGELPEGYRAVAETRTQDGRTIDLDLRGGSVLDGRDDGGDWIAFASDEGRRSYVVSATATGTPDVYSADPAAPLDGPTALSAFLTSIAVVVRLVPSESVRRSRPAPVDLELMNVGPNRVAVLRIVRDLLSEPRPLSEVRALISECPTIILERTTRAEAEQAIEALRAVRAQARIRRHRGR